MGNRKQRIIPAHYSWNSSIFTRGVVDPIKRKLGWVDENERPVSLKEPATGQKLDRMKDAAKGTGKLVMTGLAFSNPVAASAVMAPLITGSQAYFMTEGLKDAYNRVTSPNKTAADGAMIALDVAVPAFSTIRNGAKYVLPEVINTSPTILAKTASAIIPNNIKKRGIEVAMRTTENADPIPEIIWGWQASSPERKRKVLQYVFFGKQPKHINSDGTVWYDLDYNHLARDNQFMYTGMHQPRSARPFYDQTKPAEQQSDIIGHIIYGNDLNPQIATEVPNDGFFASYLSQEYPKLASKIKTYETKTFGNTKTVSNFPENVNIKTRSVTEDAGYNEFKTINGRINVGGHLRSEGRDSNGNLYIQEHDIYKFNPEDYIKRWDTPGFLNKFGLTFINDNITPVIFRTPIIEKPSVIGSSGETSLKQQGGILKRVESGKSGIHIKPENRGKFTALKKRTGKSSTWYKEHGTPAQKKMAVFALNAKKWKHK